MACNRYIDEDKVVSSILMFCLDAESLGFGFMVFWLLGTTVRVR